MPTYRDKTRGRFVFEFDRQIPGAGRIRVTKLLPKTWNQAQADAFDRAESGRLYATATGIQRPEFTIEEAVRSYLEERAPHLKNRVNVEHELALMFSYYQERPMSALPDVCKAYKIKAAREDGTPLAPATVRNRIRYLTAACRWAWKHHNMAESDPGARVITPTVSNERKVFIDRRQMLSIARACQNRKARMAIRIAFYSGMRLGEILRAVPQGDCWHLADTKNGQPRLVPIHPRVAVCARRWQPLAKITVQKHHRRAARAVGLGFVHFHDLRHSAASELINAGVDLFTVGAVLGHKDGRSTQRYAHLATGALTLAVGMIGRKTPDTTLKKVA